MDEKGVLRVLKSAANTLVEIGKRLLHADTTESMLIQKHLGVSSIEDVTSVSSMLSKYQQVLQTAVLEEYLTKKGYKIDSRTQIEDGRRVGVFEYVDIEIDYEKVIKVVGYGHVFISNEQTGERLVIQLEEYGYQRYKIRIFMVKGNQDKALAFLRSLDKYSEEHNILKGKKITPSFHHIKPAPQYTWDSVILPSKVKIELQKNVDLLLRNVELYKKSKLTFKRGLILKGPPGTGKTLIGKVLCNVLGKDTTFLWVTPGDLGEAIKIKIICELARGLSPTVLFLEDVDLYGGHRERENRGVLGELMNQLDGLIENEFVIVIATTNRAEELEVALRNRPGRFDRIIDIPAPDEQCRKQMFDMFLSSVNVRVKDCDKLTLELAKKTDGYTGAHVKELINSAIISAVDEKSIDEQGVVTLIPRYFYENLEVVKSIKMKPLGFSTPRPDDDDEDDDWRAAVEAAD